MTIKLASINLNYFFVGVSHYAADICLAKIMG